MNRLKRLRQNRNLNMRETARQLNIPYTTYVNYEKGVREPNSEMLITLANFFGVSIDYLLGRSDNIVDERVLDIVSEIDDDILEKSYGNLIVAKKAQQERNISNKSAICRNIRPVQTQKIPMLGEIACGQPMFAEEQHESYIESGTNIKADFCLRAKGDSMINARILDGDIVFIHRQPMVENGEIAAVIIEDDATLKRVYYYPDQSKLVLQSENPAYPPFVYVNEELNTIKILGKAIAFQSDVK